MAEQKNLRPAKDKVNPDRHETPSLRSLLRVKKATMSLNGRQNQIELGVCVEMPWNALGGIR